MFEQFIEKLSKQLQKGLPGEEAHLLMAPYGRKVKEEALKLAKKPPKKSAVLILFYPVHNIPHIVLILRKEYEGVHSAQVGLPGGKIEEQDTSLQATALREAEEEIGIDRQKVKVIGQLSEIYIPPSGYLVEPYVGYAMHHPAFIPEPTEVDRVIETPVQKILEDKSIKETLIEIQARNVSIQAPYFDIQDHVVWGATAMILSELREVLVNVE